jgi:hypothetical protein
MRLGLLHYYNRDAPRIHLNPRERDTTTGSSQLVPYADIYDYALLDGRRITPTTRSTRNTAGSSLVQVRIGGDDCAGEIRALFLHRQPGVPSSEDTLLALVDWMVESGDTPLDEDSFVWRKLCVTASVSSVSPCQ